MTRTFSRLLLALAAAFMTPDPAPAAEPAAFTFFGTGYFLRWSTNGQHEFTPDGQTNLAQWTNMVTFNRYADVADGDALASRANAVLERYKAARGLVVRTDSVPRTPTRMAEHLVVVLFPQPEFIEAAFTRFLMRDGRGLAITVSHRKYGRKIGNDMSDWLKANGPATEKALMSWDPLPPVPAR